ncbi:MAG: hypothetical protein SFZ24_03680 [Planctomycetota bacterium]|nr:hypothetical protein [Planctomycetota bacterium]
MQRRQASQGDRPIGRAEAAMVCALKMVTGAGRRAGAGWVCGVVLAASAGPVLGQQVIWNEPPLITGTGRVILYGTGYSGPSYEFVQSVWTTHGYPVSWSVEGWRYRRAGAYWAEGPDSSGPLREVARRLEPGGVLPTDVAGLPGGGPAEPPRLTPMQEGLAEMRAGAYGLALSSFLREDREVRDAEAAASGAERDRRALRLAAVALAAGGRMADAVQAHAVAEGEDPRLASAPMDGAALLGSSALMRRVVTDAVRHAHAAPSAEAWNFVAALMDAEGRVEHASRMRERARGLLGAPQK